MSYSVKEIYYALQGEGAQTGRPAVFCRFAGCNLWTGREADRAAAVCRFCDTDFVGTDGDGGGVFATAADLAAAVAAKWPLSEPAAQARTAVAEGAGSREQGAGICADRAPRAIDAASLACASGSVADPCALRPAPSAPPSGPRALVVCTGGEPLLQLNAAAVDAFHAAGFEVAIETNGTKLPPPEIDWICVSPKAGAPLVLTRGDELKLVFPQPGAEPERFAGLDFRHFFLQPMDGPQRDENTQAAIRYCLAHPQWRLSLQTHKLVGLR